MAHAFRRVKIPALMLSLGLATSLGLGLPAAAETATGIVRLDAPRKTLHVAGTAGADAITITGTPDKIVVDLNTDGVPEASYELARVQRIVLRGLAGNDALDTRTVPSAIKVAISGGAGDDTITSGDGADRIWAGAGSDAVFAGKGNDAMFLGSGDDRFGWAPGDGNDDADGQAGTDTQLFLGAGLDESVKVRADGRQVRFVRDVGNVVMELDRIEILDTDLRTGDDTIDVGDLSGTGVREVIARLGNNPGSQGRVIAHGTRRADHVLPTSFPGSNGATVGVSGLSAAISLDGVGVEDQLEVRTGSGNDKIESGIAAGTITFTGDGGRGDDTLLGGTADETLIGGPGSDVIDGNQGNDTADLGSGKLDVFIWDPGDGSDAVRGGSGTDVLAFRGSNGAEKFALTKSGRNTSRFTRDLGNIVMDLTSVEVVDLTAMAGADDLRVGDLTGSGVRHVEANLSVVPGTPNSDAAIDTVTIDGTDRNDKITVTGSAKAPIGSGTVSIEGFLPAGVNLTRVEPTDRLVVNGRAGIDTVDTAGLAPGTVEFTFNQ